MIKESLSVIRVAALCLPLALVGSCGGSGSSGSEAVQGTTLSFNPESVAVSSTPDDGILYLTQGYQATVRSPTGDAQIGVKLTIVNNNGGLMFQGLVAIDPATISCTAGFPPTCTSSTLTSLPFVYETTTDSTGTARVTLLYPFNGGAKGTASVIEAFSGTAYNKSDVVFTCVNGPSTPCP